MHECNNEIWIDDRLHDIQLTGGGSSQQPAGNTTTTQTTTPWAGQQPYLTQGFQAAANLYGDGTGGPQYFQGNTVAAPSQATQTAQQMELAQGINGSPTTNAANASSQNILSQNYLTSNPSNSMYGAVANSSNPALGLAAMQAYGGVPGSGTLSGIANNGGPVSSQYNLGNVANGSQLTNDPYLKAQWDAASGDITNAYQTAIAPQIAGASEAAGRFGSGSYANAVGQGERQLGSSLATAGSNLFGNAYQQAADRQLSAASTIQQAQLAQTGLQSSAANALGQNSLAATGQLGQLGQQQTANQLAAAQGIGSNYNTAGTQQIQTAAIAPSLQDAQYQNIAAVSDAGAQQDALAQANINAQIAKWNYQQTAPYQNLSTFQQMIQGNYGGQTVTSQPYYKSGSNALGGALSGAASGAAAGSMFGPWGTAIGAVGGGLFGGLSG